MVSLTVSTICWTLASSRLAYLLGRDLDRARQAGQQVAAAQRDALLVVLARVGGADGDLDVLGGSLAEQQVVLASGVGNDVLVELVAADAQAAADHDAAQADDGDFRRAAADVDDEAAGWLADGQAGADRRGHGLLDEPCPSRARVEGRVTDGALLDFRDADSGCR